MTSGQYKLVKLEVRKQIVGIAADTAVNLFGEKLPRQTLESLVSKSQVKFMFEAHDSDSPPVGIIEHSWVEEDPKRKGIFLLKFRAGLFDPDVLNRTAGISIHLVAR